jgi:hypothetical protein
MSEKLARVPRVAEILDVKKGRVYELVRENFFPPGVVIKLGRDRLDSTRMPCASSSRAAAVPRWKAILKAETRRAFERVPRSHIARGRNTRHERKQRRVFATAK